ncbi:hypothetical protein FKM82_014024 [Ascaphus truei]
MLDDSFRCLDSCAVIHDIDLPTDWYILTLKNFLVDCQGIHNPCVIRGVIRAIRVIRAILVIQVIRAILVIRVIRAILVI